MTEPRWLLRTVCQVEAYVLREQLDAAEVLLPQKMATKRHARHFEAVAVLRQLIAVTVRHCGAQWP